MLYPSHVTCLYVCTAGQRGPALGSDEQEIVYMSYVIVDVNTNKIAGFQQYLVRPSAADVNENLPGSEQLDNSLAEQALGQSGRPLQHTIQQFDSYVRSLHIDPESPHFRIITDGQPPLRQCLHPEACAKGIELPSYYCRFHDLRKEFRSHVSASNGIGHSANSGQDLSRALVPLRNAAQLQADLLIADRVASFTTPTCLKDMLDHLSIEPSSEGDFHVRESRDMVTIVQRLIAEGHRFDVPETINLVLEPGICSKDDEIDGSCIVRARGLPWQSSDRDIARFFIGLNIIKGGVALCLSAQGRRNGEALVRFVSQEHRDMALKRHKHHIGSRYIEVYRATGEDFLSVAGGASTEAQAFLSRGAQVIVRMRGLPYDCTASQVLEFFSGGEQPCTVLDGAEGVLFVKKPDGRATGDAFVLFADETDAPKALSKHRELIGARYIELFRSTTAEVQQVLNRSMDPKTYETPAPPLIAQLPQVPLLPQHVITSGTLKDCIRLRGLPYEAQVEHILHFLEDFAKNIVFQGVHMVYNAQGQPSGEAFIQMDSEQSAFMCAQQKHHRNMVFGKKQRYIEVFQCSGEDMNLVLTGGLPAPTSPVKAGGLLSPGMLLSASSNTLNSTNATVNLSSLPPTNIPPPLTNPLSAGLIPGSLSLPAGVATAPPQSSMPSTMTSLAHTFSVAPPIMSFAPPTSTMTSIPPPTHNAQKLIPPPAINLSWENPALYAQQQAQMIAQQSLLARQNAQNEQIFFAQIAHNMNMAAAMAQQGGVAPAQHSATGLLGLQPNPANLGLLSTAVPGYGHLLPQAGAFHANPYVLVPQRLPLLRHPGLQQMPAPMAPQAPLKRSYEQAFTGDLATHGLHKRTFPALPPAPSTLAYTQFYPNM